MEEPEICTVMPETHLLGCSAEPGEGRGEGCYTFFHSGHSLKAGGPTSSYHSCSEAPAAPVLSKGIDIEWITRIFYMPGASRLQPVLKEYNANW